MESLLSIFQDPIRCFLSNKPLRQLSPPSSRLLLKNVCVPPAKIQEWQSLGDLGFQIEGTLREHSLSGPPLVFSSNRSPIHLVAAGRYWVRCPKSLQVIFPRLLLQISHLLYASSLSYLLVNFGFRILILVKHWQAILTGKSISKENTECCRSM